MDVFVFSGQIKINLKIMNPSSMACVVIEWNIFGMFRKLSYNIR